MNSILKHKTRESRGQKKAVAESKRQLSPGSIKDQLRLTVRVDTRVRGINRGIALRQGFRRLRIGS